jgi:hypothetical protein
VDWFVEENVSEKHVVSIFRAEVFSPHGDLARKNSIRFVIAVKTPSLMLLSSVEAKNAFRYTRIPQHFFAADD